jgi:hypothetical protein
MASTESLNANATSDWVTPRQAAQRFSISAQVLARMRYRRKGPPFTRVSYKTLLYRVQDVEAWLQRLPAGGDTHVRKATAAKDGSAKKRSKISA